MTWDCVWEEIFRNQAWGRYPGEDLIRFVARNFYQVPDRAQIRILELGCGPGANLWFLAREGFSFLGIDGSPTAVAQACKRLDEECPGWRGRGEVRVGDIGQLEEADCTFDAVIDSEAVCCNSWESALSIYAEASRVTKTGGKIFVRTFSKGCWGDETGVSLGHHAWNCSEGPLAGKGFARFATREEIPVMLAKFDSIAIEQISRSADGGRHQVLEWVITGQNKSN